MNTVTSYLIITFTLLSVAGCGWLMWWTANSKDPAAATKAKSAADGTPGKTGHVWDEDLEEYNNPMPRWWLGLFILTMIFALGYLVLYPGLGNFGGTLNWSQVSAHQADKDKALKLLDEQFASLKEASIADLAKNDKAMSLAKNIFAANCSTCHGSDARGARGFPNLADNDWLHEGTPDAIYTTIANGRHGVMPPLGAVLGQDGVNEVTSYVFQLSNRDAPKDWVAAGKTRFETLCAACHGVDGKGNRALGAPNLTDSVWLYGGDLNTITETVTKGRDNQMPAHLEALGESKVRLLAAYVYRLSIQQAPEPLAANTHGE
jgi:cytochrome c oxidase cbb3-type subunit III